MSLFDVAVPIGMGCVVRPLRYSRRLPESLKPDCSYAAALGGKLLD